MAAAHYLIALTLALALRLSLTAAASVDVEATSEDKGKGAICDHDGWYHHGLFCYLIDPYNTTQMTWVDAMEFCEINTGIRHFRVMGFMGRSTGSSFFQLSLGPTWPRSRTRRSRTSSRTSSLPW